MRAALARPTPLAPATLGETGPIKVPAGKTLDRRGNPLLIKLKGKVEAFYK